MDLHVTGNLYVNRGTTLKGGNFVRRFTRMGTTEVNSTFSVLENISLFDTATALGQCFLSSIHCDTFSLGPSWATGSLTVNGTPGLAAVSLETLNGELTVKDVVLVNGDLSSGTISSQDTMLSSGLQAASTVSADSISLSGGLNVATSLSVSSLLNTTSGSTALGASLLVGGNVSVTLASTASAVQTNKLQTFDAAIQGPVLVAKRFSTAQTLSALGGIQASQFFGHYGSKIQVSYDFFSPTGEKYPNVGSTLEQGSSPMAGVVKIYTPIGQNRVLGSSLVDPLKASRVTLDFPVGFRLFGPRVIIGPMGEQSWAGWNITTTRSSVTFKLPPGSNVPIPNEIGAIRFIYIFVGNG